MPADRMIVVSRKIAARPEISIGRSGRMNFTTIAAIAGNTKPHAIHIAASRAKPASVLSFSGNDFAAAS